MENIYFLNFSETPSEARNDNFHWEILYEMKKLLFLDCIYLSLLSTFCLLYCVKHGFVEFILLEIYCSEYP